MEQRHHESRQEFFGKSGFEFHQTVFSSPVFKNGVCFLQSECFGTVFDGKANRNSATIAALIHNNIERYKLMHPEVKVIVANSDNATNYKSSNFLQHLKWINNQLVGITIEAMNFSEAEAGKSECDRFRGVQKRHALNSASEGYNITSGREFAAH